MSTLGGHQRAARVTGTPPLHQIHIKVLFRQPSQNLENPLGSFLVYFNKEISYLAPTKRGKRFTFT